MNIAGVEKCSCVDWPGKIAAVVFTPGCNLNCYYCHNRRLLTDYLPSGCVARESVLDLLERRRGFLDGVVISGGEPTLQRGLGEFITEVRALGYPVKLDTNGTRPGTLSVLIESGRVDYVAMDVKAPRNKLGALCGAAAEVQSPAIEASIDLLLGAPIEYEFRTTVVPQLARDDVLAIARRIRGARRYVLQQYRRPSSDGPVDGPSSDGASTPGLSDARLAATPHDPDWIAELPEAVGDLVQHCHTRGIGETVSSRRVA